MLLQILSLLLILIIVNKQNRKKESWPWSGPNRSKKETFMNTVNETINESFISSTTKCSNSLDINQDIKLECPKSPSESLVNLTAIKYKACLDAGKDANINDFLEQCEPLSKTCVISNIDQSAVVAFNTNCKIDSNMVENMKNELAKKLKEKSEDTSDSFGNALETVASGLTSTSKNKETTKVDVINRISSIIDVKFMQEMANSFSVNQDVVIEGGGDSKISHISQKTQLDIVSSLTSENKVIKEMQQTLDKNEDVDNKKTKKGISDIIKDFFSTWQNIAIAIGLFFAVVVIIIGITFFATGGQNTIQMGIKQGGMGAKGFKKVV